MRLGLALVHFNCPAGKFQPHPERILGILGPTVCVFDHVRKGDPGMRRGKSASDLDRACETLSCGDVSLSGMKPGILASAQKQVVSLYIDHTLMNQPISVACV